MNVSATVIPFRRTAAPQPVIVGFCGYMGSGKSTAAAYLEAQHGFARTRFAAPLKNMMRVMLASGGAANDVVERMIEGDLKEKPCALLGGKSPRHAMQTLGTEWGRGYLAPSLWTGLWQAGVNRLIESGIRRICVEDVRFVNECDALHALGGKLLCIQRPGVVGAGHVSESLPAGFDAVIENDGAIDSLHRQIDAVALESWRAFGGD